MRGGGGLRPRRSRLDVVLVERGLVESRSKAQAWIMAGQIQVNGVRVDKPGTGVADDATIRLMRSTRSYVSRGGEKLAGSLAQFECHGLQVAGKVAVDVGASTGGFTDCLLQHGALRVHAVDVGHGLLHEKLRGDARVVVHERTNGRDLTQQALGEKVQLAVVDASFIGLGKLLAAIHRVLVVPGGELVALIKPQFEAGRREVSRGRGVIRDEIVRDQAIRKVLGQVVDAGFEVVADAECAIAGPKGNREHFVYAAALLRP
jgi:23S rRNA (cytidine1920-2'-O)/16S rRNA (cytidine1409-2'-O)-methyltransferase